MSKKHTPSAQPEHARAAARVPAATRPPGTDADAASGRGSPEAIQKRRVARKLNDMLLGRKTAGVAVDGRTEKRRRRLLSELDKGTRNPDKGLKPIEVLRRVHDLLELGEPMGSIRKVARVRANTRVTHDEAVAILRDLHAAYGFRPEAYRFLGLPQEALADAHIAAGAPPRRGRPPRNGRAQHA